MPLVNGVHLASAPMGRQVDVTDLVDSVVIAERLGLSHSQNVHNFSRRYPDFPQPVTVLSRVRIWSWPDIKAWAVATGRYRG